MRFEMQGTKYMYTNVELSVWPKETLATTVWNIEIKMNNPVVVRHSQAEEAEVVIYTPLNVHGLGPWLRD